MADRTRLAAAGFFLALALAAVPALLPVKFAGASAADRTRTIRPVILLRSGPLASRAPSEPELLADGVLQTAISQTAPRSYSVAQGDSLWRISRDAGVRVEALAAANHLVVGATLHPGQTLVVPAQNAPVPAPSIEPVHAADRVLPGTPIRIGAAFRSLAAGIRFRSLGQPSEGLITSRFGWRTHPIFGTREFHTGVDIANRAGTPIRAAESGIVRFVGWMGGYGRLIVVAHPNGFETSYSHLSAMLVGLGQRVARGDVLGHMGSSGWSTGPHLFFEMRQNGVPIDPLPFLQAYRGVLVQAAESELAAEKPAGHAAAPSAPRHAAASPRLSAARQESTSRAPAASPAQTTAAPTSPAAKDVPLPASEEHRAITGGSGETASPSPRPAGESY